jgi:hypothetical protein
MEQQLEYFPPMGGDDLYATFGCGDPQGDLCEAGFVHYLPDMGEELVPCPGCGGPSHLVAIFELVEH